VVEIDEDGSVYQDEEGVIDKIDVAATESMTPS
jgi:hypothetical protein